MPQVPNFPRERFTEMTDGHLSTRASVLGWPAGFFLRNSPSAASGSHGLRPSAILDQPEQRSPTGFTDRASATAASLTAEDTKVASSSTPEPARAGASPISSPSRPPHGARGTSDGSSSRTRAWRMGSLFCSSLQ